MRTWIGAAMVAVALAAAGCGGDDAVAGGMDGGAADSAMGIDAGPVDTGSGPADAGCDLGDPPADLPALTGQVMVLGGDAGTMIPMATGGELEGTWRFDTATFYFPPEAEGQIIPEESTLEGEAWASADGTEFRMHTFFDLVLETAAAGAIPRVTMSDTAGTYTIDESRILVMPTCRTGGPMAPDGGPPPMITLEYSSTGTDGFLIIRVASAIGNLVVVLEGTRTPIGGAT